MKSVNLQHIIQGMVLVAALCARQAYAQFPGDIFFAAPNITAVEGQTAETHVQIFAGTRTFGAAMFDVVYDPALVQVEEVTTGRPGITAYSATLSNRTAVATFNDESLTKPFGTVEVIRMRVRPLVTAGNSVQLTLVSRGVLDTDGNAFTSSRGFSTVITVIPGTATFLSTTARTTVNGELAPYLDPAQGEVAFRRAGHRVLLWEPAARNNLKKWRARWWHTRDPAAPRD